MATEKEKEEFLTKAFLDVGFFVENFLPQYVTAKVPDFHREMYTLLRGSKRLLIAAPRGFAKSMICSVFYVIWSICFKQKKKILIISASEDKSVEFLRTIKFELENNKVLQAFFGNLVGKGKWTEGNIITTTGIEVKARGAEGQIRGYRPDLIILDDIETEDSVATPDRRNKLETWIFKACFNSLTPGGQFVWVGTVITSFALICEHMERNNGWDKRKYQAYKDGIEDEAHCLWPELWNHKRLQQQKREIGSSYFASEFMNDPLSDDAAPIKRHSIRLWENVGDIPSNCTYVIAVDPAYSEDAKADEKVAVLVGSDSKNIRYLKHVVNTRASLNDFMNLVINLYEANKGVVTAVGVPNSGVEKGFYNSFVNECMSRNVTIPIVELKNVFVSGSGVTSRNKKSRVVAALQPLFEQGRYFIGKHMGQVIDQLLSIGSSRHDDIVDALTYAEQLLVGVNVPVECEQYDRYGHLIEEDNNVDVFGYDY